MTMIVFNICCGNSRFPITRPPDFIRHGLWGLTGARCQQGGGADLQGPRLSALWQTGMQHSTTVSMSWLQDDRRSPARWRFPSMGVPKIDGLVHEKSHEIGWLGGTPMTSQTSIYWHQSQIPNIGNWWLDPLGSCSDGEPLWCFIVFKPIYVSGKHTKGYWSHGHRNSCFLAVVTQSDL